MKDIFLASKSPRRRELLAQIGLFPQVIGRETDENSQENLSPQDLAQMLALKKVQAAAPDVALGIVISADTVVALDGKIYGKPQDQDHAVQMLLSLSGRTHSVITGLALCDQPGARCLVDYEETKVTFKSLSLREIKAYVQRGESFDKAGAYGIQGIGALLVEGIAGDYFNVVGLPLQLLSRMMQCFEVNLLENFA